MRTGRIGLAFLALAVGVALPATLRAVKPAAADGLPSSPAARDIAAGDPLRKILLDTLRPVAEQDLGQPVIFVVDSLRVQGRWAFATVHPRTPAGWAIDFRLTRHATRMEEGMLGGDAIYALMRQTGARWVVRDYVIGPTDVAYAAWPDQFGAPAQLMGLP